MTGGVVPSKVAAMKPWKPSFCACLLCAATLLLQGCAWVKKADGAPKTQAPANTARVVPNPATATASTLLSMSFEEAALIAPQHIDVPYLPKVAADNIEVLRKFADGSPRKIRAKGRVFLELDQKDHAKALCEEALIDGGDIILRGRPIVQRGTSTVEGLSDVTVFYLLGSSLKAIGKHRLTNIKALAGGSPWQSSYATLLPPLDSGDVPAAVRDEMRKAAEAEAQLQRSRVGLPPAFPDAVNPQAVPVPEPANTSPAPDKKKTSAN